MLGSSQVFIETRGSAEGAGRNTTEPPSHYLAVCKNRYFFIKSILTFGASWLLVQTPANGSRAAKIAAAAFPVLDKIYADFAAQRHVPGLAYGLIVDGQLVHAGAVGYTDVAARTAATPQSVFRIASMTKSFVALAVLRLRDESRLRLDDPAENYLTVLKKAPHSPSDTPPFTIRQLLSHSAGLPEDNPWGDRQMGRSNAELSALVGRSLSVSNAPGVGFEYSNLGYALLGRLVTRLSGQPVQAYISEKILRPLGMSHTT
ncbi:serine hydrolase domain-containing protein [Hymenobacter crusticola]|uniref:serine hydrolase domain-containing protein n=1 Tax=Hymenobacter crusticola TaxID=1770526 RepID=UPI000A3647ED|nr:serine hydrolase domain-containing protein [Hymenobacter crusticola]